MGWIGKAADGFSLDKQGTRKEALRLRCGWRAPDDGDPYPCSTIHAGCGGVGCGQQIHNPVRTAAVALAWMPTDLTVCDKGLNDPPVQARTAVIKTM